MLDRHWCGANLESLLDVARSDITTTLVQKVEMSVVQYVCKTIVNASLKIAVRYTHSITRCDSCIIEITGGVSVSLQIAPKKSAWTEKGGVPATHS